MVNVFHRFASVAFFLLFPGFFLYQVAIGVSLISPFLGGYLVPIAIVIFPVLLVDFLLNIYKNGLLKVELVFLLLILYVSITAVINYLFDQPSNYAQEMLNWSGAGIVYNLVFYFLVKSLGRKFFVRQRIDMLLTFLVLSGIVISVYYKYGEFELQRYSDFSENVATYQGFARVLLFFGFVLIGFYFKRWLSLPIFIIAFSVLYLNGARTEFFLFVFSSIALFIYMNFFKPLRIFGLLTASIAILILADNLDHNLLPHSRVEYDYDINTSQSFESRLNLSENAWNTIKGSAVFGDYGSYANTYSTGGYSHNILSSWVNLGMLGVFFYLVIFTLLMYPFGAKFVSIRNTQLNAFERILFLFIIYTVLSMLFLKDYLYLYLGIAVGMYSVNFSRRVTDD